MMINSSCCELLAMLPPRWHRGGCFFSHHLTHRLPRAGAGLPIPESPAQRLTTCQAARRATPPYALGSRTASVFAAAYTTAEGNEPLTLDFVFAAGATPVYQFASCEFDEHIEVLLPLCAALIPPGAVTPPSPHDPMHDPRAVRLQCHQDEPRNDRGDDYFDVVEHLGQDGRA